MDTTDNNHINDTPNLEVKPDQQYTTSEVVSAQIKETQMAIPVHPYDEYIKSVSVTEMEDIKSFCARPVLVQQIDWLTSNLPTGSAIYSLTLPEILTGYYTGGVFTGGNSMISNKLSGFLGFRADCVVRITLNGSPFQQGLLLVHFVPFTNTLVYETAQWNYNLTTMSQHNRILLDVSCDTEGIFKIPFVYPAPFINLQANDNMHNINIGSVYLQPYGQLKAGTGGANDVEVSVFVSFENMTLIGPSIPTAQSNSAIVSKRVVGLSDTERNNAGEKPPLGKSITNFLRSAGDIAGRFPVISAFSGPLQWMSELNSATAKYFGYGSQVVNNTQSSMQNLIQQYWNNSDANRVGYVLGSRSDNEVAKVPGFAGTDYDEMNLSYIAQKYAYVATYNWDAATAAGTVITNAKGLVSPSQFYTIGTVGSASLSVSVPSPFTFVARSFVYWRGSVKFKFIFVKTKFHSGRLVLSFNPGNTNDISSSMTVNNTQYTFRHIIDIREGNEFEVTFPYVSPDVWNRYAEGSGTWTLHILNPLKYPSTVSSNIDIILEVAAGPDIEFAVPDNISVGPITPTAQSNTCDIQKTVIGGVDLKEDTMTSAAYCIGEKVASFKQLLSRPQWMNAYANTSASGSISFVPWHYYGYSPASAGGAQQTTAIFKPDYYSYVASKYALCRGGMLIGTENYGNTVTRFSVVNDTNNTLVYDINTDYTSPTTAKAFGANYNAFSVSQTASALIKVPFYHRNPASLIRGFYGSNLTLNTNDRYTVQTRLCVKYKNSAQTPQLYRGVADDFQLGYFVSTTPVINWI